MFYKEFLHQTLQEGVGVGDAVNGFFGTEISLSLIHAAGREQAVNDSLSVHIRKLSFGHVMDQLVTEFFIEQMDITIGRLDFQNIEDSVSNVLSLSRQLNSQGYEGMQYQYGRGSGIS